MTPDLSFNIVDIKDGITLVAMVADAMNATIEHNIAGATTI
jgi:hypothetical protein